MRAYAIQQYVLWTLAAVLTMGLAVAFTLAQPPSTLQTNARGPSSFVNDESIRRPAAAIPASTAIVDDKSPQAVELQIPCDGATSYGHSITHVRLSGASCNPAHAKREIASVELLNDANGFSATVFYPTSKSFTTDYVALNEGTNNIKILIAYANGEREERSHLINRK